MPEPLFSMTSSKRLQALRHWRWTAMTLRLRIPAGILGDFVVGKGKGAPFGVRQALHLDHRHLLQAEQSCRRIAAVAGNDQTALVDQNRDQKAEGGDAVSDLTDLLLRVSACVTHIR